MRLLLHMLRTDSKVYEQLDQLHGPRQLPFEELLGGFSLTALLILSIVSIETISDKTNDFA